MSESIICRLCLTEEGEMDYIFSQSSSINFIEKIHECTELKLHNCNELPSYICEICKSELIIWFKFKRQCIKTNRILQSKYEHLITAESSIKLDKFEKSTQTEIVNELFDPNIDDDNIVEFHQEEQDFTGTQNEIDDDEDDINKFTTKKDKILNLLTDNDNDELTDEYTILEYDQHEINEYIDHTYTEVESTSKANVFKINMDKIDDNIINDDNDKNIMHLNKKTDDNKIQIYSLLNINGEDDTVELNHEIDDDNNYNESENVEMLLDSDDNAILGDEIDNYNDDHENINNNSFIKIEKKIIDNENDNDNLLWHTSQKTGTKKRMKQKSIGLSGEIRVIKSFHGKRVSYSYPCTICGQMQTNLKQHMRTHTEELPFKCPYSDCARAFRQASNLKNHINIHTGAKPYPCKLCERKFSEPSGLRSHMVLHTGERKFHCTDCGKSFGWSHTLKAHQRIHTQDRRHPCSVCSKRFLSAHALKKHVRIHTGEKPYECQICGKSFNTSGNLSSHKKTHLKEHSFHCHLCTEKFQHLINLKKHIQKIHKQDFATIEPETTTTNSTVIGNEVLQINDNNDEGYKIEILLNDVTNE